MTQSALTTIRVGHSPDSDDAFMFYALTHDKLDTGGLRFVHQLEDIETLNHRALNGELEVSAVSIHAFAHLADRYALLASGAVRPKTGDHDVDTKVSHARKFLEHNDKVLVTVIFRGREMQHQEEGRRVLNAVMEKLADVGKVERPPMLDGKRMTALLSPKAVSKGQAAHP